MLSWPRQRGLAQALCLLPVVLAPLLGGTSSRPYTLIVAALCAVAGLGAYWMDREARRGPTQPRDSEAVGTAVINRDGERPLRISWFGMGILVALAASVLQLVPLPPPLRRALAPGTDLTLRRILSELGGYPHTFHALSVDPSATANEVVRLGGYLCLLLALSLAFARRGDGARLLRPIYLVAGGVALLGLLAALHVPLPPPLSVSGEGITRAKLPACFLNSNHMAALLSIGAILTLGAALEARWPRQPLLLLLLALLDMALLGTLSRGGIVVGVVGQAVVLLWPRGIGSAASVRRFLLVLILPVAAFVLCLTFASEAQRELQERFAATALANLGTPGSKVRAWIDAWPLLRGHFLLGVGRGAFENAFQGVSSLSGSVRFVYLENEWLQVLCDFGVPLGMLILGCLALGMRGGAVRLMEAYRQRHFSAMRVAAYVALWAVALHNLVDFNLEVGGVALPVLVLGAVVGRGRFRFPRRALLGLSLAVLVAAPLAQEFAKSHDEDARHLVALAEGTTATTDQVLAAGRAALLRHPLDSYLSAVIAARLWQDGRPEAADFVNRALLANPSDILALRTSALILAAHGYPSQGATMLRFAIPQGSFTQRLVLYRTALAIAHTQAQFLAALPDSPAVAAEVLDLLGTTERPRWSLIRAVGTWAEGLHAPGAVTWLATAALAQGDADAAASWAQRLVEGDPPSFLIANIAALLLDRGRGDEGEVLCQRALQRAQTPELHLTLALILSHQAAPGLIDEARRHLDTALSLAGDSAAQARVHDERAALEDRQGNPHRARQERLLAARLRGKK